MQEGKTVVTQGKLDSIVTSIKGAQAFMHEGLCHAVTQFVACDDHIINLHSTNNLGLLTWFDWVGISCHKQDSMILKLFGCYEAEDAISRPANSS